MTRAIDVSSHAPLLERLQGRAFLPGVDYVTQAQAWMQEAADEINRMRKAVAAEISQIRAAGRFLRNPQYRNAAIQGIPRIADRLQMALDALPVKKENNTHE